MIFHHLLIYQCVFRYTTTDNNNGEDTSTICDESTINGDDEAPDDASSANGSVINVKANFTKMSAEAWLSSIDKEKKKKEGKSQRQLKSRSALLSGSSEESMGSKGGTLTRQLLKAHDHAHRPIVRHGSGFGDEESSVYSVDQEGFYTSMHKDSGLKHTFADQILEEDVFASPTLIDSSQQDKEKRKSLVGSGKKRGSKKNKKTPPPPPQRASSTLSKSNLTLHMDDSGPTSHTQNESSMDRSKRAGSNDTTVSEQSNNSKNKQYESASESDAEAIYARIKVKSSISAAAIPSLCSVTPLNSDEEDMDMLAFSSTWRPNGTTSSADTSTWTAKSTPDFRPTVQGNHFTSTPNANLEQRPKVADFSLTSDPTLSSFSITSMTKDDSFTDAEKAADSSLNLSDYSNGCSTWPRSPNSKADSTLFGSLLKTVEKKPPRPQISQLFNSPDNLYINDRTVTGSFKGSNDGSIGPSSSKSGGSGSTTTLSSIPSSTSDEQPNIPDKYKPSLTVKPRSRSSERTKSISVPEPIREHVYANVIVQETPTTTSGVQTVSITKNTSHYASSSVVAKAEPKVPTSTFTSSPYAVGGLASSETSKSVPSRSANASTTTAISSPASSGVPSRALSPTGKVYAVPIPAPAKLIISSPVSGQISFKENPYKRSVCSPVSAEELLTNWNTPVKEVDKCYNSLPRKPNSPSGPGAAKQQSTLNLSLDKKDNVSPIIITNQDFEYSTLPKKRLGGAFDHIHSVSAAATPMSPPPSQPLFPSISAMKHSVSFPVTEKEVSHQKKQHEEPPTKESKSATYGGSWYDGIKTKTDSNKPIGLPNSDSFNSISSYMSAPPRSCFSPNRNSADSFTLGQRRDSIASTISTDSSGRSKTGFLSSILKASPSGSKTSVRTDEDTASITSGRSDEKPPTFSFFTKPPSLGLPLAIKRTASVGSQGSEGSGKGVVPAVPPVVPSNASTISGSNTQPINRPTSLAISPTTEVGTKRTRQPDQCTEQQDGQTEAKALILTTIKENETPKSTKPPRRSPVRVVYPASPTKTQKSPSPEAGPFFGKPKTTVIVSAQNKRSSSPPTRQVQPTSAKIETTPITWPSKSDSKPSEGENRKSVLSSFAPLPSSNSSTPDSTVETTRSGVPLPPTRESSLPRKSTLKQSSNAAVSSVSTGGRPTVVSSTSEHLTNNVPSVTSNSNNVTVSNVVTKTVSTNGSSVVAGNRNDNDNSKGLPRYPVFVKPKTNNTSLSKPLSLYVAPSSDDQNVPSSDTNAQTSSKPRSESLSSNDSSSASRPTNLDNMSISNLNRSTGSLVSGLSVLSSSNTNLNKSSLSLYKSSESLASTNSNHAEKTRAAKLAFLSGGGGGDSNTKGPQTADPFARFKVNGRKSSTGSTVSSSSIRSITSNGPVENTNNSNSESSANSTPAHKLRQSPSQGRFVASKIELLRRKSVDTPPPSPESPSSGLGSSICSPLSPVKLPPTVGTTDFTNFNGHQAVVNNNCKSMIPETQIEAVIS